MIMFHGKTKALSNALARGSLFLIAGMKVGETVTEFGSLARVGTTHMLLPVHLLPSCYPSKNYVPRGKQLPKWKEEKRREGKGKKEGKGKWEGKRKRKEKNRTCLTNSKKIEARQKCFTTRREVITTNHNDDWQGLSGRREDVIWKG